MRNVCVRDAPCWDQNSERVKCVECKLLLCARPRTDRWNAYTKRDIENLNEYLSIINFRGDLVI